MLDYGIYRNDGVVLDSGLRRNDGCAGFPFDFAQGGESVEPRLEFIPYMIRDRNDGGIGYRSMPRNLIGQFGELAIHNLLKKSLEEVYHLVSWDRNPPYL